MGINAEIRWHFPIRSLLAVVKQDVQRFCYSTSVLYGLQEVLQKSLAEIPNKMLDELS
jgi:hypothetical protein